MDGPVCVFNSIKFCSYTMIHEGVRQLSHPSHPVLSQQSEFPKQLNPPCVESLNPAQSQRNCLCGMETGLFESKSRKLPIVVCDIA